MLLVINLRPQALSCLLVNWISLNHVPIYTSEKVLLELFHLGPKTHTDLLLFLFLLIWIMKKYSDFTIIVPTYNEAQNISDLAREILGKLPGAAVIVVDDCSNDGTSLSLAVLSKNPDFHFYERTGSKVRGISASVLDGISLAKTKYIIVMDGDFQHPPEKLPEIAASLISGNDLVVASRRQVANWAFHRQIISKGASFLARSSLFLSGRRFDFDIMSGFFGMKKSLMAGISKERVALSGYKILFDIFKQLPSGIAVASIPYYFGMRKKGSSKIRASHIVTFLKSAFS